jgi:hypothetical protein
MSRGRFYNPQFDLFLPTIVDLKFRSAGLELYEIVTNIRKEDYQDLVIERLSHVKG